MIARRCSCKSSPSFRHRVERSRWSAAQRRLSPRARRRPHAAVRARPRSGRQGGRALAAHLRGILARLENTKARSVRTTSSEVLRQSPETSSAATARAGRNHGGEDDRKGTRNNREPVRAAIGARRCRAGKRQRRRGRHGVAIRDPDGRARRADRGRRRRCRLGSEGRPLAAFGAGGSEAADGGTGQSGKRRLALGELVDDGAELPSVVDHAAASEEAEHSDADDLQEVGDFGARERRQGLEDEPARVIGSEHAVEQERVQMWMSRKSAWSLWMTVIAPL